MNTVTSETPSDPSTSEVDTSLLGTTCLERLDEIEDSPMKKFETPTEAETLMISQKRKAIKGQKRFVISFAIFDQEFI